MPSERARPSRARRRPAADAPTLLRFDGIERTLHWVNARSSASSCSPAPHSTQARSRPSSATATSCAPCTCTRVSRSRSRSSSRSWAAGRAAPHRPRTAEPLVPRRRPLVPAPPTDRRQPRKVQPGPEGQRRVHRRCRDRDARDRCDHEVVRAVPARLAHRRDLRPRLVRARHLGRGARAHRLRAPRRRRARQHARRYRAPASWARTKAPLWYEELRP